MLAAGRSTTRLLLACVISSAVAIPDALPTETLDLRNEAPSVSVDGLVAITGESGPAEKEADHSGLQVDPLYTVTQNTAVDTALDQAPPNQALHDHTDWPTDILDWQTAPVDLSFLNALEKPAGKH